MTLIFEDELTIRYQIQEMLRAERIFEEEGIGEELDAYNPLVPDGSNWKATMMIEYPDEAERRAMLAKLIGIEDRVWVQVEGCPRVYAIADEDLERETDEKTAVGAFPAFRARAGDDRRAEEAARRFRPASIIRIMRQRVSPLDAAVTASLAERPHRVSARTAQ